MTEIKCLITFEVVGKPKKHVDKTLNTLVDKLKAEKEITIKEINTEEAEELEEEKGFFSAFSEIEVVLPHLELLNYIAINLMPASIEILEPANFSFPALDMQNWYNDLLSQLHQIAHALRGETQKNQYISTNLTKLLQNMVTILLTTGPKDVKTLQRMTGVEVEHLEKLLEHMKKEKLIEKDKKEWKIISPKK